MKKLVILVIILGLFSFDLNAQSNDLELRVIEYSQEPDYKTEHFHLLSIKNTTSSTKNFTINTNELNCNSTKALNVEFAKSIYTINRQSQINEFSLVPGQEQKFYLKFSKPRNINKQALVCTQVTANAIDNSALSNTVIIRNFISESKKGH